MKKSILILGIFITIYGCEERKITVHEQKTGGKVIQTEGIFSSFNQLDEFYYKGHLYISCSVRDGISLTHAGHCKCNK